jgi:uncharacterized membrane protein YfcA
VPFWEFALLMLAGLGAGLVGSIAGLASLISYPALLAVGLAPVTANVTNTVALISTSTGAVLGSRPELRGQAPRLRRLGVAAVLGGALGGALLLLTPDGAFERVVPVLVAGASLAVLIKRPTGREHSGRDPKWLPAGIFVIAIYGGYFGAAAGVLMLATLLIATPASLPHSNASKNVLLGAANAVAAIAFVIFGHVQWSAALPLAIGLFVGGRVGPIVVRRAPSTPLRVVIAIAGIGLAVKLAINAY